MLIGHLGSDAGGDRIRRRVSKTSANLGGFQEHFLFSRKLRLLLLNGSLSFPHFPRGYFPM